MHAEAQLTQVREAARKQDEALRAEIEERVRAATAERDRIAEQAAAEARQHAEAQLAAFRATARQQKEDLRESGEAEINELRGLLAALRQSTTRTRGDPPAAGG